MLRYSILVLAILCGFSSSAQDMQSLQTRAKKMYEFMVTSSNDSLIQFIHPSSYSDIPKEQFLKSLTVMNENEDSSTILLNITPNFKFGDIKKIGIKYYSICYYNQMIKVTFKKLIPEADQQYLVDIYSEYLNTEKGVFKANQNALYLEKRVRMIAIADAGTDYQWTFFGKVADREVREELGL